MATERYFPRCYCYIGHLLHSALDCPVHDLPVLCYARNRICSRHLASPAYGFHGQTHAYQCYWDYTTAQQIASKILCGLPHLSVSVDSYLYRPHILFFLGAYFYRRSYINTFNVCHYFIRSDCTVFETATRNFLTTRRYHGVANASAFYL